MNRPIAFPCISTGAYRFLFDKACGIALQNHKRFLNDDHGINKIYLVVFSESDFKQYHKISDTDFLNHEINHLYRPVGQTELELVQQSATDVFRRGWIGNPSSILC